MPLDNTAAVVAGCSSGFGTATAAPLAAQGFEDNRPRPRAEPRQRANRGQGLLCRHRSHRSGLPPPSWRTTTVSGSPLRVIVHCAGIGPSRHILSKGRRA
jgi:NAD(P)-dependent dehydrogenase (short-subunit alcohol dehydrogenase family)